MNDSNTKHDDRDNNLPLKLDPNTINSGNYLNVGDPNSVDLHNLIPSPSFADLERCISNPLMRGYSNVSVSSDDNGGHPHFLPYGRNHEEISFAFTAEMLAAGQANNTNDVNAALNVFNPAIPRNMSLERLAPLPDIDSDANSGQQMTIVPSRPLVDALENIENIDNLEESQSSNGHDNDREIYENNIAFVNNDDDDAIEAEFNDTGQAQNTQKNNIEADDDDIKLDALANPFVPDMTGMTGIYVPPNRQMNVNGMNMMQLNQFPLINAMNNVNMNGVVQPQILTQTLPFMNIAPMQAPLLLNNVNINMQPPTMAQQQQMKRGRIVINNNNSNEQDQSTDYSAAFQNYMKVTNYVNNASDVDVSPNQSPNHIVTQNNIATKERRNDVNNNNNNNNSNNNNNNRKTAVASMEITEVIKLNLSLTELMNEGMICKFMKHQNGSRYIQEKLKNASNSMITCILNDIILQKQVLSLSEDIFGNYVIQIFFENGNKNHHDLLTNNLLKRNVYRLSRSFYGCRVIQTALDYISQTDAISLIKELKLATEKENDVNLIHECIICPNANHVIQKIISLNLEIEKIKFIIDCIDENICFYSSHIFGCRIVQNIVNYYGNMDDKKMLYEMISSDNLLHLCQSQYGNYVIQHILALQFNDDSCQDIKHTVIKNVFDNVLFLSKNKYGSNVVERCLIQCDDQQRGYLVNQICGASKNNKESKGGGCLNVMVRHKYANYVIQKLLQHCNSKQQNKLIWNIEKNIPNLRSLNYGKHIMDRIKRIKMSKNSNQSNNQYGQYY